MMAQTNLSVSNLSVWEVVNPEIARNRQPRINWNRVFGMSLSKFCAIKKADGKTWEQTLAEIIQTHPELSEEAQRRAKIGICARYGEQGSAARAIQSSRRRL